MIREEYPRPQFVREKWKCLNGSWDFKFADEETWRTIQVPFAFQAPLSEIGINKMCDDMTYKRLVEIPKEWKGKRIHLHFGAVDYRCKLYVNDSYVGGHTGGNTSFSFDITEYVTWDMEEIRLEVNDPCKDESIPRGKQFWQEQNEFIWYTRTSGIWQSVWMEPVEEVSLKNIKYEADIDMGSVMIEYECTKEVEDAEIQFDISMEGTKVTSVYEKGVKKEGRVTVFLLDHHIFHMANHGNGWCWSPESPRLFDIKITILKEKNVYDEVDSYFGMRKIEVKDGKVYLNNRPYYQKLVLDQGYWPEGLLTAPTDDALKQDIIMAKEMGFNGCRKHQKAEDPRFLYWADKLGYLVWGEIAACPIFTEKAQKRTIMEWTEAVYRDYNHPSIVAWVVLNESWGVPQIATDKKQQAFAMALYYHMKSLDDTRLVISNDGWELVKTDICAIHNYNHGSSEELEKQEAYERILTSKGAILASEPAGRKIYAKGYKHEGEPILLTEFGGVSYNTDRDKDWGYTSVSTDEEYLETYERMMRVIRKSEVLFGYCYTQLTDVEQEVNGLLTYDRKYKVKPEEIKKLNDMQIINIL